MFEMNTGLLCTFLVFVLYLMCVSASKEDDSSYHHYKISMVSSEDNPGQPAFFSHGASPVWDMEHQSLYFVDVTAQNVHRLDYATGNIHTKHIEYGEVNVVSLVVGSSRLLVGVRAALYLLEWGARGDAALRLLAQLDVGSPDNVLAHGAPDAEGRFWAGTKGPQSGDDVMLDRGSLYSIEQDTFVQPRLHLRPVTASAGVGFAHNNSVLYYLDSPTQKVEAFDYDIQNGAISGRRTVVDISSYGYEEAMPSGLTVDSEGHLWVALGLGGTVIHIDPDSRRIVYGYKLPVSRVTAVCWGGPKLDELFVTTARDLQDAGAEPLAGAIFTIRNTGSRGMSPYSFRFDTADVY